MPIGAPDPTSGLTHMTAAYDVETCMRNSAHRVPAFFADLKDYTW